LFIGSSGPHHHGPVVHAAQEIDQENDDRKRKRE